MKVCKNQDNIVIYIYDKKYKNLLKNDNLEDYFKELFIKLKDSYDIKIAGYYDIVLYLDKYYGAIIILEKEDIEYYSYLNNQIDMQITRYEDFFLYKIKNTFLVDKNILDKVVIYKYKNNFYFKLKAELSNLEFGRLIENSDIVFGDTIKDITRKNVVVLKNTFKLLI